MLRHEELNRNADKSVQALLVGTHCHRREDREVTDESARRLAEHFEVDYVEVSCEKNLNVELCFEKLVDKIMEKYAERVKVPGKERIAIQDSSESSVSCSKC